MVQSYSVCFDRAAGFYDVTRGFPAGVDEEIADAIVTAVGATQDTHFLEVGIGTGRIALPLIRRGYAYSGIDISEEMLAELRRKLRERLGQIPPQVSVQMADATALPFGEACFDVAITVHVLHLIREWQQVIGEIRRVLRPGGVYLYGYGDRVVSARGEFDPRWTEILAGLGFAPQRVGASTEEVEQYLQAEGARLERVVAAEWPTAIRAQALFDWYAQRSYSASWQIPEEIFTVAIRQFQEWFRDTYPDPQVTLLGESQFQMLLARW
ncbi:class I SAM-dependent methyltransferase [Thermostichus vulcanus]|uniref:Class I SAM-dependent methyltransferase n=1 Tax=Thermostichus vulcanus str. 'Rupite' TaxID=2813851 RepID=A0ABT0CFT3_THEVL|nr:class I SAM-dependent methyltransferase [Thermostichus vulcanus]MCJ2544635.1 class I SAM-dependent methyltransferase [Thermostichus vulcanus str. 'Rupite']